LRPQHAQNPHIVAVLPDALLRSAQPGRSPPFTPARYSPIPVDAIYAPVQPNGTADDALASGKVERTVFPMAAGQQSLAHRLPVPHVKTLLGELAVRP
jgi:hypothetical protein